MKAKYHDLLESLEPFIVSHPKSGEKLNYEFMDVGLKRENCFNPFSLSSVNFIERIYKLDELSFGGAGMGMPRWVFFDCAAVPGAVIGFGIRAANLSRADRKLLDANKNDELIPLSMYIAIPSSHNGWFGHNLSSLASKLELDCSGLGLLTKYYALGVLNIKTLTGATQWNSLALKLHLKLSPLKIVTSFTPIHSIPETLCYETNFFYRLDQVLGDESSKEVQGDIFVATKKNIYDLQLEIEKGSQFTIYKALKENEYLLKKT